MTTDPNAPALSFFRATPPNLESQPPLASSLQSFETCLFLVSLGRFPPAVVACLTAWESAMKAHLRIPERDPQERKLADLLAVVCSQFPRLKPYSYSAHAIRKMRNRLVHFGFSPKDDEKSAVALLEVGLPFLDLLYQELFAFVLDWKDIREGIDDFKSLTDKERAKAGLLPEVAEQLRFVKVVYGRAKRQKDLEKQYCFHGLRHFIMRGLTEDMLSSSESTTLEWAETHGLLFDHEYDEKKARRNLYGESQEFWCPICGGCRTLIAELDLDSLKALEVVTKRCACVKCQWIVGKNMPYLSMTYLEKEIAERRAEILAGYGFSK